MHPKAVSPIKVVEMRNMLCSSFQSSADSPAIHTWLYVFLVGFTFSDSADGAKLAA
jgi:hypothetical protein